MTQKERLVELLLPRLFVFSAIDCDELADYLLDNGVIVLPLVVGNFFIPFESGFDYETMKAFKSNEDAKSYLYEITESLIVFDCEEANDE